MPAQSREFSAKEAAPSPFADEAQEWETKSDSSTPKSGKEEGESESDEGLALHKNPRDPFDVGATPSTVPRQCTDIGWLLLYVAFSAVVVYVGVYAWPRRHPGYLLKLADWQGEKCGLGHNQNVSFLYFCLKDDDPTRTQLNMMYPICVSDCPLKAKEEVFLCPRNLKLEPRPDETTTTSSTTLLYQRITEAEQGGYTSHKAYGWSDTPYPGPRSPYMPELHPVGEGFTPYWQPADVAAGGSAVHLLSVEDRKAQKAEWKAEKAERKAEKERRREQKRAIEELDWGAGSPEPNYELPPGAKESWFKPGTGRRLEATQYVEPEIDPDNIVHSDWRGNFTLVPVSSYASATFVGLVCKPWPQNLEIQVQDWIDKTPLVNTWATLINSYWPLLVAAASGVILSYVYITLLRFRASMLVWAGLTILTLGPLSTGLYFLWCWKRGDGQCWASTGDKLTDAGTGFGMTLIGITFMTITCNLEQDVELAINCIEWSCKAVLETPSLKMEPVLALTCRGIVDFAALCLIAMILTSDLQDDKIAETSYQSLLPPQDETQITMLAIVTCWCLWTNWIITAVADFVIMYTTELWFFNGGMQGRGHAPCCSILRGYFICLRYHFGTVASGGLIVGTAQPFRIVLGVLSGAVRMESNSVCAILSCCCSFVVELYEVYLDPLSRNAYMDLALNAHNFYDCAYHAADVNAQHVDTVHILNGATWLFQVAGLGAITFLGHMQTCLIIKYYPGFEDRYSPDYVQNPFFLSICGAVVSFVMSFPFMMIFDTVSDTILFCWIVEKNREEKDPEMTLFQRACGFAQTVDDLIGYHCFSKRKDIFNMPVADQEGRPAFESLPQG
ncbi:unnamed protein product [Effrenium voratum]|uniref:Uncharacterized protein n=1 Tax=Effrenium voratum TaxID=2562239 RepID=A0AA36I7D6_9DINO|nr:unnamed protein product [Effrenium voratum]CAJ1381578.1 unnamed protein product [Effrenium voratum]